MASESQRNPPLTLEQMLPSPKDRPPSEEQTNVVYRINCADCSWSYIGETGRAFITRKKEHMKNVEKHKAGSNIANHAWSFDHKIDFKNCKIIDKANYRHRATLESWHTALTTNADNNSKHLPEQYRFYNTGQTSSIFCEPASNNNLKEFWMHEVRICPMHLCKILLFSGNSSNSTEL